MKNKLIAKSLLTIFNSTPKYIKFKHDYNILEFNDGTFEYGARPQFNKPAAKTDATIKKEQK